MAKLKSGLFSLKAQGGLGDAIAMRHSRGQSIAEKKPIPPDAKSPGQLSWRHMFQKALTLWHALSAAEKQEWESAARPKHMTGYTWFMSQCLRPNPGIYLPLQGGTMQGNIDMANFKITALPDPTANGHASRKKYVDDEIIAHKTLPDAHTHNLWRILRRGAYQHPDMASETSTAYTILANRLYAVPFNLALPDSFNRIGIRVTTAVAGTSIRLGVYEDNEDKYPSDLVLDAGFVSSATTNNKSIAIVLTLPDGDFFLVFISDGAVTIRKMQEFIPFLGGTDGTWTDRIAGHVFKDQAYGVLPDPFPAGGSYALYRPAVSLRTVT